MKNQLLKSLICFSFVMCVVSLDITSHGISTTKANASKLIFGGYPTIVSNFSDCSGFSLVLSSAACTCTNIIDVRKYNALKIVYNQAYYAPGQTINYTVWTIMGNNRIMLPWDRQSDLLIERAVKTGYNYPEYAASNVLYLPVGDEYLQLCTASDAARPIPFVAVFGNN